MAALPSLQGGGAPPLDRAYLATAVSLLPGVELLGTTTKGTSVSRALTAGFALECALKAFLANAGFTENELRKKPWLHDLEALWGEAEKRGLKLPSKAPSWVELLNSLHNSPYHLRYPTKVNGLVLPGPDPLTKELRAIVDEVEAIVCP